MKYKMIVLVLSLILLSGCATHNVAQDYSLTKLSQKAVIFGSITQSKSSQEFRGLESQLGRYMVHYRKLGSTDDATIHIDTDLYYNGDFNTTKGEIFVIELDPGEYEFYSWFAHNGRRAIRSTTAFSIPFKIKPGTINYIGEINMEMLYTNNSLVWRRLSGLKFDLNNSYQRDRLVFNKKYKNLANAKVRKLIENSNSIKFTPTNLYY